MPSLPSALPLGLDPSRQRQLAAELGERLARCESRKSAWEMLRAAGLTQLSLRAFYARVRAHGVDGLLDTIVTAEQADAVAALLARPVAPAAPRVAVSTLANQFYCEMQVELDRRHDVRVVSREMLAGTRGHAAFEAEAEELTAEEIQRRIAAGEGLDLVELSLAADLGGVRVAGRADRVCVEGRRARLVLEFKFSGRREIYPSHVAQVEAYGALLAARGFDIDGLVHAVAVLPRGASRPAGLANVLATAALDLAAAEPWAPGEPSLRSPTNAPPDVLDGLGARAVETDDFSLWVFRHDPARARAHLDWALDYWRGRRAPTTTATAAKCRACPLNAAALCDAALAPPDGRYEARQIQGPGGLVHLLAPRR